MNTTKLYEYELYKLRKENIELQALRKSVDLYVLTNQAPINNSNNQPASSETSQ